MTKRYGRPKQRQRMYSEKDEDKLWYCSSEEDVRDRYHDKGENILKQGKKRRDLRCNHDYDYIKRYGRIKRLNNVDAKYDKEFLENNYKSKNKDCSTQCHEFDWKLVREGNFHKTSRSNKLHSFDSELKGCRNKLYLNSKSGVKDSFYNNGDCRLENKEDSCADRQGKYRSKQNERTVQHLFYRQPSFTSSLDEDEQGCYNCNNQSCDEKLVNSIIEKLKYDFNITPKDKTKNVQLSSLTKIISKDTKGVYVFVPLLDDDPKQLSKQLERLYKSVLFGEERNHVIDKQERITELKKLLNKYSPQNPKFESCKSNLKSKVEKILNSVIRLSPNESNNRFLRKFESHLKTVWDKYIDTKHPWKYARRSRYDESDYTDESEMFEYYAEQLASLLI